MAEMTSPAALPCPCRAPADGWQATERVLPEAGQVYDLPTLLDVALRDNPDTRAAWEAARAAAARYGRSLAPFYPEIRAQAEQAAKKGKDISAPAAGEARDLKAEAGKVDVKTIGPGGTEQVVTIEIVRPAVPAAVVDLMTRKQSADRAAQMGDILVDQIPGGLTVMSSIVPPRGVDGSRRRLSPTQTPYFRVFERGERLVPKPGRADDFAWPRQACF